MLLDLARVTLRFLIMVFSGREVRRIKYGPHTIKVELAWIRGKRIRETIFYGSRIVSEKKWEVGAVHSFCEEEDGEAARYEIRAGEKWGDMVTWLVVRRNGLVIYSEREDVPLYTS